MTAFAVASQEIEKIEPASTVRMIVFMAGTPRLVWLFALSVGDEDLLFVLVGCCLITRRAVPKMQ